MTDKLNTYNEKRDFRKTSEPTGEANPSGETKGTDQAGSSGGKLRFVVQKHAASRLHYDFRLEFDGVLWSWAVPKGPSYDPKDKRLAVQVEDHPLAYRNFEGTIPKDEYGGGTVMLLDEGTWEPQEDAARGMTQGSIKMILQGQRLKGKWALVKMKPKAGKEEKNWLLIKEKDSYTRDTPVIDTIKTSVRSGRTMKEIALEPSVKADKIDGTGSAGEVKGSDERSENGLIPDRGDPSTLALTEARTGLQELDLDKPLPFRELTPMLATLVRKMPPGNDWIHELKFDGYRILCFLEDGKARLMTRNGNDWSHRMPELVQTLEDWAPGNIVLDGEAVVLGPDGKSDFQALQDYFKEDSAIRPDFMLFDLLAAGDKDLRNKPLLQRKALLEVLLEDAPAGLLFSHHTEGRAIFEEACGSGMEGIIAKKKDAPYRTTRSQDWVKVKCNRRQEFVMGGYTTTGKSSTGISALLLGVYDGKGLIYKGRCGTGITAPHARTLLSRFRRRKTSPFTTELTKRTNETITYVTPALAAEIQFAEFTEAGLLRQASFKGLREDKDVKKITWEEPTPELERETAEDLLAFTDSRDRTEAAAAESKVEAESSSESGWEPFEQNRKTSNKQQKNTGETEKASAGGTSETDHAGIMLTSPERILYPDEGLTKQDVAEYYWEIRDLILPYLIDRPMTLIRCADSISGECFFQKHMTHRIQGMTTENIKDNVGKPTDVMIMKNEKSLMGAIQMGAVEFHSWGSTLSHLEEPDWLVFDLDPDAGMGLNQIRLGAWDLKSLLDELSLTSYLKTSGGKGYHIVVPLIPLANWESTRVFAKLLARGMEEKWPDRYTSNIRKDNRKGRIFIDWVRNNRSSTSVSVFSLRSRTRAPISWPLRWEDLNKVAPNQVTLENFHDYLDTSHGWKDFFKVQQRIRDGS